MYVRLSYIDNRYIKGVCPSDLNPKKWSLYNTTFNDREVAMLTIDPTLSVTQVPQQQAGQQPAAEQSIASIICTTLTGNIRLNSSFSCQQDNVNSPLYVYMNNTRYMH